MINRVDIDSDNRALTRKLLAKTARQAQGRCLGSEGIRLLAYTLQNELIAQGYITSLIDVPSQSLEHGILRFTLHYGKVGAIDYADGSDTTRLWNSLPTSSGTILRLSDLEQRDGQPAASARRHRAHETVAGPTRGRKRYPDRPQHGEKMAAWRTATTPAAKPADATGPAGPSISMT